MSAPAGVTVWVFDTAPERLVQATLSDSERARIGRSRVRDSGLGYATARVGLRHVMSAEMACSAKEVVFKRASCPQCGGGHGKPFVRRGPRFSVTHTGRVAAVAVCADREVGLDAELPRAWPRTPSWLGRLPAAERRRLSTARDGAQRADLVRDCWVRKEAALKLLGVGLSHGLDIPTGFSDQDIQPGPDIRLHMLRPRTDVLACLATAPDTPVTIRSWRW
ncbi:4'-phosphopantetheinyl transferase family protein [Luteipulveratus mongoliensis]|uniref:4'-phosphopantetheinyl transferase family protein n=1 Tax=Luteipulveratus mongoliensis TaxID=571913 RepID=UPI0012ED0397|nr:4'-phosphopantetheinyl transferase superfamily protein [Luteipulveratus mongoliensis]